MWQVIVRIRFGFDPPSLKALQCRCCRCYTALTDHPAIVTDGEPCFPCETMKQLFTFFSIAAPPPTLSPHVPRRLRAATFSRRGPFGPRCRAVCLSMSIYPSGYLSDCLSLSVCLYQSVSVSQSLSVCLCQSVSASLSLSLSVFVRQTVYC